MTDGNGIKISENMISHAPHKNTHGKRRKLEIQRAFLYLTINIAGYLKFNGLVIPDNAVHFLNV